MALRAAVKALSVTGLFVTLSWWFTRDNNLSNLAPHKPNQALSGLIKHTHTYTHTNSILMMFFYELGGDMICRLGNVLLLPSKIIHLSGLWRLLYSECGVCRSYRVYKLTGHIWICICTYWSLVCIKFIYTVMTTDLASEWTGYCFQNESQSKKLQVCVCGYEKIQGFIFFSVRVLPLFGDLNQHRCFNQFVERNLNPLQSMGKAHSILMILPITNYLL